MKVRYFRDLDDEFEAFVDFGETGIAVVVVVDEVEELLSVAVAFGGEGRGKTLVELGEEGGGVFGFVHLL